MSCESASPSKVARALEFVDRRLLAEKIGRDDQPVAAGGARIGEPVEPLMDREASVLRRLSLAGGELAREPVERRAAGRHAAVGDEKSGLEMVVEEEARVGRCVAGCGQDVDRAAELEQNVAGADHAGAERRGDVVRRAADDRRSGLKSAFRRAPIRDDAENLVRGDLAWQCGAGNMGERDQRVLDRVGLEVDETGFERPVLLDCALAGEAPVDVVVGAEHGGDAGEDRGFVALDPSELGGDELLIDSIARLGEEGLLVDLGPKLGDFGAAARVALLNARTQEAPGGIEQHDGRQHSGHADGGHIRRRSAACAQKFAHDLADVRPPLLRILLGPADMVGSQGDRPRDKRESSDPAAGSGPRWSMWCRCRGRERKASLVIPAQAGIQARVER